MKVHILWRFHLGTRLLRSRTLAFLIVTETARRLLPPWTGGLLGVPPLPPPTPSITGNGHCWCIYRT